MRKCHVCNECVNDAYHIYRCDNSVKSEVKYRFLQYNFPSITSKEDLTMQYAIKSMSQIHQEFGIDLKSITFLLDYHNISRRGISESKTDDVKLRASNTCLKKYGVANPSQSAEIKEKKKMTSIKNYGVDNIRKCPLFRERLNDFMLQKFGQKSVPNLYGNADSWGWQKLTEEEKLLRLNSLFVNFTPQTEEQVKNILVELQIDFKHQYWIDKVSFDFYVKQSNMIIEVNGDHWHANPAKYKATDKISKSHGVIVTAEDIWKKDEEKKQLALSKGYNFITIWETDIRKFTKDELTTFLKIKLCYER